MYRIDDQTRLTHIYNYMGYLLLQSAKYYWLNNEHGTKKHGQDFIIIVKFDAWAITFILVYFLFNRIDTCMTRSGRWNQHFDHNKYLIDHFKPTQFQVRVWVHFYFKFILKNILNRIWLF